MKRLGIALLALLLLLASYSVIGPYLLEIKNYTITSEQVPPAFDGFKIVFLSDIHRGPYFSENRVAKLVYEVNDLNPDMVLLGGDYVHVESKYMPTCFTQLSKLQSQLKFGVLGNHDYYGGKDLSKYYMASAGIRCLNNHAVWIARGKQRIKLGGVGDLEEDVQDLSPTIRNAKPSDYVILLSHNPDYAETLFSDNVDLVLSGHTHGGQIAFFGLWTPVNKSNYGRKYLTGLVQAPHTQVLVSNGIGTVIVPIRFGARPQIVEITLKHKAVKK
ncbi:MAG: metallophosphoesterase [Candidatus Saccharibacteria bacterium]